MKKKLLTTLLSFSVAAAALTGCGSGSQPAAGTPDAGAQPQATEATDAGAQSQTPDAVAQPQATETPEAAAADSADPVSNLIAATSGTVTLSVWAAEEDQDVTGKMVDSFKAKYGDVDFDIKIGVKSESDTKDTILADAEAAADVFAFADDQLNELVKAGAIQEVVQTYTFDVKSENLSGSVDAATLNGKLYAYPMTADNGYFLYYDSSVLSESDVESMDKMTEVAAAAGKKVGMIVGDGWYNYSFFKGAGYDVYLNEDGLTNTCKWNEPGATDVARAIIELGKNEGFSNLVDDAATVTGVQNGDLAAVVTGVWNADAFTEAWGDNLAATKLPTYTVAGGQVQMSSFSGYKLIGINPHSKFLGWAMLLAEHLTNEENQVLRFNERKLGPSNIKASESSDVQESPAIAALAKQAEYATPQRVGGNYWDPAKTLGQTLITGNPDGADLQELLDNAVAGIEAPVQ